MTLRVSFSALASIAIAALVFACTSGHDVVLAIGGDSGPPPAFTDPDASGADAGTEVTLRAYCPSDRCPPGHTTCPNSAFLCDVNLRTDPDNCGECGNVCPSNGFTEEYSCIEGRCVMGCEVSTALDCDGLPDNGCETSLPNSDHCGACGLKCPADKPCIDRAIFDYGCGCEPGELACGTSLFPCVDPKFDDLHCGGCNKPCPFDGGSDGGARPPNSYFGCFEGACGTLKCLAGWADCDGLRDNGCEVQLTDNDNCGACGNTCQNGMSCRINAALLAPFPECMCPAGQTFCQLGTVGTTSSGICTDLTSDPDNCGACKARCAININNAREACVYGACERTCLTGWGDCNGNRQDGCETNIAADPKNCGGCGEVCNGIAGQACIDGQCMVEPCDQLQDAGDPTR